MTRENKHGWLRQKKKKKHGCFDMMSLYSKSETMTINSCQLLCGLLCLEGDILNAGEKYGGVLCTRCDPWKNPTRSGNGPFQH